jgi:NADPH:quinone reductase-like Zn-dependent oxidoreductase
MRAIVQEGYGSADVLHLREIDKPIVADDHVLVAVRGASVNAADCHFIHGVLPIRVMAGLRKPKVGVRGVDLAGVVEAIGRNVTRFKPGDEVFGVAPGTFAECASTTEGRLVQKPPQLTFEQAAAVPVAATTALQGLRDKADVQPGQRVLVYGAGGGVGSFAVQIAKAFGAYVTAVTSTRNMDLVRSLGPDELIDYTREDFSGRGQRYDVFFDVAATRPLGECQRVLEPNGTFVIAGAPKGNSVAALAWRLGSTLIRSRFLSQRIVTFLARVGQEDLLVLCELIEAGRLFPAIDRTYQGLGEVPDAVRYVLSGQARAKVVIKIG